MQVDLVSKCGDMYRARIQVNKTRICIGMYDSAEEAYAAYRCKYIEIYEKEPRNEVL